MPRTITPFGPQPFPLPAHQPCVESETIPQPQRAGEQLMPPATYLPLGNPDSATKPRGVMPEGYPTNTRPINPNPNPRTY